MLCLFRLIDERISSEATVRYVTIRLPRHLEMSLLARLQVTAEFEAVRIPCSPPSLGNDRFPSDLDCCISRIIKNELIVSGLRSLYEAFVGHFRTIEAESFRQIHHTCHLRSHQMFEIKLRFKAHKSPTVCRHVGACEASFPSLLIIHLEHVRKLAVVVRIAETHHGIAVHQDAISFIGQDERHRHFSIVLKQFFILSFIVEFVRLMLTETVEGLILRRFEHLSERPSARSVHLDRIECLATSLFFTK